jgi:Lrp/AsnC family leucine-responsive transcriptional regulator
MPNEERSHQDRLALDEIDVRLLAQLQRDASLSNEALARSVHVSPATSLRRVRRLDAQGVIERRVALLDPARIGPMLQAISEVTLDRQGLEHLEAFEARVIHHAAVQQCYRVSPGPDFIVVAAVADMVAWGAVVAALFTQNANVRNVKTFFCVRRAKFAPALPLPGPEGSRIQRGPDAL